MVKIRNGSVAADEKVGVVKSKSVIPEVVTRKVPGNVTTKLPGDTSHA
jgi:hypothetical protein